MSFINSLQLILYTECQQLSYLTMKEYAIIGASLRYSFEDRFQCNNMSKFKTADSYKMHQMRNNCRSIIKNKAAYHKFDYIGFKTCFCNFYTPKINPLITIATSIEKFGVLPSHLTNQKQISSKLNQVVNIINGYIAEYRAIEMEKQHKQMMSR